MFSKKWLILMSSCLVELFFVGESVLAGPEFGGDVETLIYCDCTDNWYVEVGDPEGGDYIKNSSTTSYDCEPLAVGEWILGMSTENTESCEIEIYEVCVEVASGEIIDYYGSSDNDCGSEASTDEYTPRDGTHDDKKDSDTTHDDKKDSDTTHDDKKDSDTTHKGTPAYGSGGSGGMEFGSSSNSSTSDNFSSSFDSSSSNSSSESGNSSNSGNSNDVSSTGSNSDSILSEVNNDNRLAGSTGDTGIGSGSGTNVDTINGGVRQSGLETQLITSGRIGQIKNGMEMIQMVLVIFGLGVSGYFILKSVKKVF